jgi:hypothetical protein
VTANGTVGLVFRGIERRRDFELVLTMRRATALLDGMCDLVGEQVLALIAVRIVVTGTEVNVLPHRVRLRTDRMRRLLGCSAGVHAHTRQIGSERLLELAHQRVGKRRARGALRTRDGLLRTGSDAVRIAFCLAREQAAHDRRRGRVELRRPADATDPRVVAIDRDILVCVCM